MRHQGMLAAQWYPELIKKEAEFLQNLPDNLI